MVLPYINMNPPQVYTWLLSRLEAWLSNNGEGRRGKEKGGRGKGEGVFARDFWRVKERPT